jgi:hypothetical protein
MGWKRLVLGDLIVLIVGISGIAGSVALLFIRPHETPSMVLIALIALGIVCIIVRFLDGVDSAQFKLGDIFKVGGSAAVIFGALYFFSDPLERQLMARRPEALRPLTAASLSGTWVWQHAGERWLADLKFADGAGGITFDGMMWVIENHRRVPHFSIQKGIAEIVDVDRVALSFDAVYPDKRTIRLESVAPLALQLSLRGGLREVSGHAPWGIGLQKDR